VLAEDVQDGRLLGRLSAPEITQLVLAIISPEIIVDLDE